MSEQAYHTDENGHKILRTISPNDEMYGAVPDVSIYLSVSASAINCIDLALRHAGKPAPRSVLDLPCGHGRVLRSLVSYYPNARHVACDLNRDGVDFCAETFGVEGVYSDVDTAKIPIDEKFDLIWCGSLLTHLSEENTLAFLDFFIDHMEDGGVLVASFHGRRALARHFQSTSHMLIDSGLYRPILEGYNKGGYGYSDYNSLEKGYGVSATRPSWVTAHIENRTDVTLLYYSEHLWADHHDMFAIQKKSFLFQDAGGKNWRAHQALKPPPLTHPAKIALDDFFPVTPGTFAVRGWGILEGVSSFGCQKYVALKSATHTYLFGTDDNRRPDVTGHYGQENYDDSGFDALLLCGGMAPGTYEAGVLIVNGERAGVAYLPGTACTVV